MHAFTPYDAKYKLPDLIHDSPDASVETLSS